MTKINSKIEGNTLGILRRSFFPFNALGMPSFNNSVSNDEILGRNDRKSNLDPIIFIAFRITCT